MQEKKQEQKKKRKSDNWYTLRIRKEIAEHLLEFIELDQSHDSLFQSLINDHEELRQIKRQRSAISSDEL